MTTTAITIDEVLGSDDSPSTPPAPAAAVPVVQHQNHDRAQSSDDDDDEDRASTAPSQSDSVVDGEPLSLADAVYNFATTGSFGSNGENGGSGGAETTGGVPPAGSEEEEYYYRQMAIAERYAAIGWTAVLLFFLWYQLGSPSAGLGDDGGSSSSSSKNHKSHAHYNYSFTSHRSTTSSSSSSSNGNFTRYYLTSSYPSERMIIDRHHLKYVFLLPILSLLLIAAKKGLRNPLVPWAGIFKGFSVSYLTSFWIIIPVSTIGAAVLIGCFCIFVPANAIHTEPATTHFGGHAASSKPDKARELFSVAAQVFAFVMCSEIAKIHFFETAYARARLRIPQHYNYLGLCVAFGFAALETVIAGSFDRIPTTFLATIYNSDLTNPRTDAQITSERKRALYLWWMSFGVAAFLANSLTSYLMGMALARRDMRIINSIEDSALRTNQQQNNREEEENQNGLDDEQKPLRRPFYLSVIFRTLLLCSLGIMMDRYFYVFPQHGQNKQLSDWPRYGVLLCPLAAAVLLFIFVIYVIAYEKAMLPESYLKVTGGISTALPILDERCCLATLFADLYRRLVLDRNASSRRRNEPQQSQRERGGGRPSAAASAGAGAATAADVPEEGERMVERSSEADAAGAAASGGGEQQQPATGGEAGTAGEGRSRGRRVHVGLVLGWEERAAAGGGREEEAGGSDDDADDDGDDDETRRLRRAEEQREERRRQNPDSVFIVSERPLGYQLPASGGEKSE